MSDPGFPIRPARSSLGPTMVNTRPVRNETRELDAGRINLTRHQVGGLGLMTPLARLALTVQSSPALLSRYEAWNPSLLTTGVFVDPTLAYISTGIATIQYPAAVVDQNGDSQNLDFQFAIAHCISASDDDICARAWKVDTRTVRVVVRDAAGSVIDGEDVVVLIY